MNQIVIRPATLDDVEQLRAFEQEMIKAERPFDETIRDGNDVRYYDLEDLISSPEAEILVAEFGSDIIGSGYARLETSDAYLRHDKHSYLGFMYVVPEHRGKGVNRMIIDSLEAWSLAQGVTEVRLEVYSANVAAIKAYEKSGYNALLVTMRKSIAE